jgi:cytochrome c556
MRKAHFAAVIGAAVIVGLSGVGTAWSEDAEAVIKTRQETMKAQSKALAAIRAYIEDKGELAAAQAAGDVLVASVAKIPGLFPEKSGMAEYPDKSKAKPDIWTQRAKFDEAAKAADAKAKALNAALKGGDKAAITEAYAVMYKGGFWDPGNACGGCHTPFQERKKS